jgi:hypothetical protein
VVETARLLVVLVLAGPFLGWWALLFRGVPRRTSLPPAGRRLCCCSGHQPKLKVVIKTTGNGKFLVRVSGWVVSGILFRENRVEQLHPASGHVLCRSRTLTPSNEKGP